MILIVSTPGDEQSAAVLHELDRHRASATLLDLSHFPQQMHLSLAFTGSEGRHFSLRRPGQAPLNFQDYRVVWWRRPQHFTIHPEITNNAYRNFAYNESHEAFAGLWQSLEVFWVNHPTRDEIGHRKVLQLCTAQDVGLSIPRTLISNDVEQIRQFVAHQGAGGTIYKAFSATEQHWRETRLLREEELALLDQARYAPVIFQEYVEAVYDVRVTIVGEQIFPAAIHSQSTSYKVDFRMDIAHARIEPVRLPPEVEAGLRVLMERLGLAFGAIDMRLTPEGRYVFLEINPAGQWLFIERFSGQPITASLARLLIEKDQ